MSDLFSSLDYRAYLRDHYEAKKALGKGFSFQVWARLCGFAARDYLMRVMRGERNLSDTGIESLSKYFGFQEKEARYFKALVVFNQAKTPADQEKAYKELLSVRRFSAVQKLREDQYEFLTSWHHAAMRSLLPVIPFHDDWEKLGQFFDPALTAKQAKDSVDLLLRLGLVSHVGKKFKVAESSLRTGDKVRSLALSEFHKRQLELAKRSIDKHPASFRDISGVTMSLSAVGVENVKRKLAEFRKSIMNIAAEDQNEDRVMQLNLHLFPLTRVGGKIG